MFLSTNITLCESYQAKLTNQTDITA